MGDEPLGCCSADAPDARRRTFLGSLLGASVAATLGALLPAVLRTAHAQALTREQRDQLSPQQVLEMLKRGNERFRSSQMHPHDYLAQKRATVSGQYPAAAILSCIDSRAPAEILLDAGIGETFNARIAGNIANDDLLGSLEFACAAAGAKLLLVIGHTSCGAIKGAIDGVELGHLTELLNKIKPAVAATAYSGERSGRNAAFVDAVAATNVSRTVADIRTRSSVLAGLEKSGTIAIVGSMYHLQGGQVEFFG